MIHYQRIPMQMMTSWERLYAITYEKVNKTL